MNRQLPLLVSVLVLLGSCTRAHDGIQGVGTLELVETDLAPLVPAKVTRVWVEEGDAVNAGDTLVSLTRATITADVEARRAGVAMAEATLRDLQAGARPAELDRLAAELRSLETEAVLAERDLARMEPLLEAGSISEQQLDAVRTAARAARARADVAGESLRLLRQGARPQQLVAARAEVERARAALQAAEASADELVITASAVGVVLARHAEPGEILAAGEPALTLADPTRPWMRIFLSQADFPLISVGHEAVARLDAFPDRRFHGRVTSLARRAEFTPRVALTERERADLLFGVRIEFTDTTGMLKAGLPATVTVLPAASPREFGGGRAPGAAGGVAR